MEIPKKTPFVHQVTFFDQIRLLKKWLLRDFLRVICPPSDELGWGLITISPELVPAAFPTSKLVEGVLVPIPTFPFRIVFPVPLGVSVTFWLVPPAAKISAVVPVIEPVVVPVPPLATATVPVTLAALSVPEFNFDQLVPL